MNENRVSRDRRPWLARLVLITVLLLIVGLPPHLDLDRTADISVPPHHPWSYLEPVVHLLL